MLFRSTLVRTPATGWGLEASREIPPEVDICVYSGEIRKKHKAVGSTHRIDLGPLLSAFMEVDGSLADPSAAPPGAMQLVNHVCAVQPAQGGTGTGAPRPHAGPNCTVRHVRTADTVGLLVLRTSRAIPAGQQLSFDYDACGGDFWSSGPHDATKAGYTFVPCRCAGDSCPLRRWRWERSPAGRRRSALPTRQEAAQATALRRWLAPGPPARNVAGPSPPQIGRAHV